MPMPVPALRTAEDYFRQAVQARTGEYRGLALKALVQTLAFLRLLGEDVTGDEIGKLAREAALLLTHSQEDAQRYVRQFIPEDGRSLADLPVPTGPAAGQSDPLTALTTAAVDAAGRDPAAATALVAQRRELLEGRPDQDMTTQLLLELRVAIKNALLPAGRKRESWPWIAAEQQALRQRITAGGIRPACAARCCSASPSTPRGPVSGRSKGCSA